MTKIVSGFTGRLGGLAHLGAVALTAATLAACSSTTDPDMDAPVTGPQAGAEAGGMDTGAEPGSLPVQYAQADATTDAATTDEQLVADPLEPWNRYVFSVNDLLYTFLRPWIAPYMVLPESGKESVDSFLHNASTPVILLNDLLQGEFDRAWVTTKRFFINTTAGMVGFIDVAEEYGMPKHEEDFGQTLGVYGVGDSPYLVLPLLGPSNPRDGVGTLVDFVSHPLFWVSGGYIDVLKGGRTYGDVSSGYGGNVDQLDSIRETSLDYYASIRSLYTQKRRSEIRNEAGDAAGTQQDIDYFLE